MISPGQVGRFQSNEVWSEIRDILLKRIEVQRGEIETAFDIEEIRKLQGAISELRFVLGLPEMVLDEVSEEKKE